MTVPFCLVYYVHTAVTEKKMRCTANGQYGVVK